MKICSSETNILGYVSKTTTTIKTNNNLKVEYERFAETLLFVNYIINKSRLSRDDLPFLNSERNLLVLTSYPTFENTFFYANYMRFCLRVTYDLLI